jgi:hypothetical protein
MFIKSNRIWNFLLEKNLNFICDEIGQNGSMKDLRQFSKIFILDSKESNVIIFRVKQQTLIQEFKILFLKWYANKLFSSRHKVSFTEIVLLIFLCFWIKLVLSVRKT